MTTKLLLLLTLATICLSQNIKGQKIESRDTSSFKNLGWPAVTWQAKSVPMVRITKNGGTIAPPTPASLPTEFHKKSYNPIRFWRPLRWGKRSESMDKGQELNKRFRRLSHFSTLFMRQDPAVRYFLLPKPHTLNVKQSQSRDVTTEVTGATEVAPEFPDTLIPTKGCRHCLPLQRSLTQDILL